MLIPHLPPLIKKNRKNLIRLPGNNLYKTLMNTHLRPTKPENFQLNDLIIPISKKPVTFIKIRMESSGPDFWVY
jgi:hypothetical protein